MPPKRSSQGRSAAQIVQLQQLSKKGKSGSSTPGQDELDTEKISTELTVRLMEKKIMDLETALAEERAISTQLSKALEGCQSQCQSLASTLEQSQLAYQSLSDELDAQREQTHNIWKNLRVECCACLRGQA